MPEIADLEDHGSSEGGPEGGLKEEDIRNNNLDGNTKDYHTLGCRFSCRFYTFSGVV